MLWKTFDHNNVRSTPRLLGVDAAHHHSELIDRVRDLVPSNSSVASHFDCLDHGYGQRHELPGRIKNIGEKTGAPQNSPSTMSASPNLLDMAKRQRRGAMTS
jgi:hypothetical protein